MLLLLIETSDLLFDWRDENLIEYVDNIHRLPDPKLVLATETPISIAELLTTKWFDDSVTVDYAELLRKMIIDATLPVCGFIDDDDLENIKKFVGGEVELQKVGDDLQILTVAIDAKFRFNIFFYATMRLEGIPRYTLKINFGSTAVIEDRFEQILSIKGDMEDMGPSRKASSIPYPAIDYDVPQGPWLGVEVSTAPRRLQVKGLHTHHFISSTHNYYFYYSNLQFFYFFLFFFETLIINILITQHYLSLLVTIQVALGPSGVLRYITITTT